MSRTWKIVIALVLAFVVFNLLLIVVDRARATIVNDYPVHRHWCRNHPRRCKREIRDDHYRRLKIDGHRVRNGATFAPSGVFMRSSLADVPCQSHRIRRQFGGHWDRIAEAGTLTEWVQYLNVTWCWDGRHITNHYARSGVTRILPWLDRHESDYRTSEWYPWHHHFRPRHNGRFEGIDSTMSQCPALIGLSCILQAHPWIHAHLHADGTWTLNSNKT